MIPLQVRKFDASQLVGEDYYLPTEKLIAGNPKQTLYKHYSDASGKFFTGVWQSEAGKWHVQYSEEEYCQLQQGISIITDHEGNAVTVSAGESFDIPRGFIGTWEVVEPTKKIYVVYEP